ncbi:MAG: hypothetical protein RLZZ300_1651, partial [Pseudomonadota bacterium]
MRHQFERLGGTAAQRMHFGHVAMPDVSEQGADRDLGRRDADVDGAALDHVGVGPAVDERHHPLA